MTRDQTNKAAFHAHDLISHASVAWYEDGAEKREIHIRYVDAAFHRMAEALGYTLTPIKAEVLEAAE